jgi:hypothetical protein
MSDEYHALASPSKSEMFLNCANSLAMNEGQPEGDRRAADLGTDKHELLTLCLQFGKQALDYEGHVLKKGHTVNREFAVDVQTAIDNVRERIRAYELRGCTVAVELEQDLPIEHITGEKDATGRGDALLVVTWPDRHASMDVIDAKFGYQEVKAEENSQLLMYGSGGLQKFGLTEEFTEVNLVIEQPARGVSDEWSTTPEVIGEWVEWAKPRAEKALKIQFEPVPLLSENFAPSEKTCMWCKAKAVCPALLAKVEETIEMGFDTPDKVADTSALPLEDLGAKFEYLELIEDWIKAVRARIELEVFAGRTIPGVKVVAGRRGNRQWADEAVVEQMLKEQFRLKLDQMYSFKLLGPKPVLELLKTQPRRLKKIEQLVVQPDGKPHVVHESDKRPAIEIKPVEDGFETVDDLC